MLRGLGRHVDGWHAEHLAYWEGLAGTYDSLYEDAWSLAENEWVQGKLDALPIPRQARVVDLGAGTGIGRRLWREIRPEATYLGVDLSPSMVATAGQDHVLGSMEDTRLEAERFDVVMALFTSASYASSTDELLAEVRRLLNARGRAYLSFLSRTGMYRLRPTNWGSRYRTRGDNCSRGVPVNRETPSSLARSAKSNGLVVTDVRAINAFSGLAQSMPIWGLGAWLATWLPATGHSIEVTLKREEVSAR